MALATSLLFLIAPSARARHVDLAPRHLQRMRARGMQPFNGGHGGIGQRLHAPLTGAHRRPAHMHRARATLRDTAAVLGAREGEFVAQIPQQRHGRIAVKRSTGAVHGERDWGRAHRDSVENGSATNAYLQILALVAPKC